MDKPFSVIGAMSGSSLDGLDLAWCEFLLENGHWKFSIREGRTVPYPGAMRTRLPAAMDGPALELARLHRDLGRFIGEACREMLGSGKAGLIASHGHTIFHEPGEGLTTQIGCGAWIAAITGTPVACDFRTKDVALGGQGAPLVPMGERHLFPDHDAFLNLGGIANISVHGEGGAVIGYDIGPCNMALNALAEEAGKAYDADGAMARSGGIVPALLDALNELPFYGMPPPRSLGREWFTERMLPLIAPSSHALPDRLRTVVEHVAVQVGIGLDRHGARKVLATGGGAHNRFLIERLRANTKAALELPDRLTIDMKEALVFAFLGMLRVRGEANALAGVTGAAHDSIGGALYLPN